MNQRATRLVPGLLACLLTGVVAVAALRASAAGPVWGLAVSNSAAGPGAEVVAVRGDGAARDQGLRPGDRLLFIDGQDARLASDAVPAGAQTITLLDADGSEHDLAPLLPPAIVAALVLGAALFSLLGGAVFRWAAEPIVGGIFLLLNTAFAAALAAAPATAAGYSWASAIDCVAAVLAAPLLMAFFLHFPSPTRRARRLSIILAALAGLLVVTYLVCWLSSGDTPAVVDMLLTLWMGLNVVAALGLLGARWVRSLERRALAPVAVGIGTGIAPLLALSVIPRLLGGEAIVAPASALVGLAAVPLGFAYAILRHRLFALDALLRRVLVRVTGSIAIGGLFAGSWWVMRLLGLDARASTLVSAAGVGLIAKTTWMACERLITTALYPRLRQADALGDLQGELSPAAIASALAGRVRELVPTRSVVCAIPDEDGPETPPSYYLLALDGSLPDHHRLQTALQAGDPLDGQRFWIGRSESPLGVLALGPRLDGSALSGIDREIVERLCDQAAAPLEAALLRQRAEEEARFRDGMSRLTGQLAAADSVEEVLALSAQHCGHVLDARVANIWQLARGQDWQRVAGTGPCPMLGLGAQIAQAGAARIGLSDQPGLVHWLAEGEIEVAWVVSRPPGGRPFSPGDERRALELVAHVRGALRRAADRAAFEEQLRQRAFYDDLTGLPNRALFLDRLDHALARTTGTHNGLAVLFIDLDRFKVVNDSLGHAAGDELLVEVSRRMQHCLRAQDTVARLGGDEFTVLLEDAPSPREAEAMADRLLTAVRAPLAVAGRQLYVSASIGIVHAAGPVGRGELLRQADIALYRAKAAGRDHWAVFESAMDVEAMARLHLESDLHAALERGELRVYYQPILSLAEGRMTAAEALVRWMHPQRGLVPPGEFIPLAEETGLIAEIGRWVLEEACRQARAWQSIFGTAAPRVSVNLSARQLQRQDLVQVVQRALSSAHLSPRMLQLEITESVLMQDAESTIATLRALKAIGIELAIDDFGTGYSSLAYLKRFPVDLLKIDRSFVEMVDRDPQDAALVGGMLGLAGAMGLRVTAEGIETPAQRDRLLDLGCDQGQGFLFSRPVPADDLERFLQAQAEAEVEVEATRQPAVPTAWPQHRRQRSSAA